MIVGIAGFARADDTFFYFTRLAGPRSSQADPTLRGGSPAFKSGKGNLAGAMALNEVQERHRGKAATRTEETTPRTPTMRSQVWQFLCRSARSGRRLPEVGQSGTEARATRAGAERERVQEREGGQDRFGDGYRNGRGQARALRSGTGTGTGPDSGTGMTERSEFGDAGTGPAVCKHAERTVWQERLPSAVYTLVSHGVRTLVPNVHNRAVTVHLEPTFS